MVADGVEVDGFVLPKFKNNPVFVVYGKGPKFFQLALELMGF